MYWYKAPIFIETNKEGEIITKSPQPVISGIICPLYTDIFVLVGSKIEQTIDTWESITLEQAKKIFKEYKLRDNDNNEIF